MEEYLAKLKEILIRNNYEGYEETIAYFRELFLDAFENGLSEEKIIADLGSVEGVATNILENKKVKIDEDGVLTSLRVKLCSADLNIHVGNVDNIIINTSDDELFEITYGEKCSVVEKRKGLFGGFENLEVNITIPFDYKLDDCVIETTSGEATIYGNFKIDNLSLKTISGDLSFSTLEIDNAQILTVSGDVDLDNSSIDVLSVNTTSGDVDINTLNGENVEAKTISGDIDVYKSDISHFSGKSTSGDLDVWLMGPGEDYHIECQNIGDKKIAHKSLKLNTISGDVDYKFEL